jgi:opacity protein-like surface antigen
MKSKALLLSLLILSAACRTPRRDDYMLGVPDNSTGHVGVPSTSSASLTHLVHGQTIAQGMIGANLLTAADRSGGTDPPSGSQGDDFEQVPLLGGAFQYAMWGDRIDAGLEVGGTLGFQAGSGFVAAGGGGLIIAVDIDMLLFDLFGGPFVSVPLGAKARLYGGAGPLMQFADWDQHGDGVDESGSGFGTGLYARTGLEIELTPSMLVGIGVRWFDSTVSLGSGLGNLDLEGTQVMITFTAGI